MSHSIAKKTLKVIGIIIGLIVALPIVVAVLLYIPPVQNWVVDFACREVSKSTGMSISVDKIHLRFPLNLRLDGVSVLTSPADTMAVVGMAEVKVAFAPLLKGEIALSGFEAEDVFYQLGNADSLLWLRADVDRASVNRGNLQFGKGLIDVGNAAIDGAAVRLVMKDSVTPEKTDTSASKPLRILAHQVALRNVEYTMVLPPVIDTLNAVVGSALLSDGVIDIGARRINARSMHVDGVRAKYLYPKSLQATTDTSKVAVPTTPLDSMWLITADTVSLKAPYALYAVTGAKPLPGFDMDYIEGSDIDIEVVGFRNRGVEVNVPLRRLAARERSGLSLRAQGTFSMDTIALRADSFNIYTDNSRLSLNALMGMAKPTPQATTDKHTLPLRLNVNGVIGLADASLALPSMRPMIAALPAPRAIDIDIDAEGTDRLLDMHKARLSMPGILSLSINGDVRNVMDFDHLGGNMTIDGAVKDPKAVNRTLTQLKLAEGVKVPALKLHGTIDYTPGDIDGKLNLSTQGGAMLANGRWNARREGYKALVKMTDFPVDAFMPSLGVGRVTATVDAYGHGYNPFRATTAMHANINLHDAEYQGNMLSNIALKADLASGEAKGYIASHNPGADFNIDFKAYTDSGVVHGTLASDIRDLDLHALGMSKTVNTGSFMLNANGTYNPRNHDIAANIDVDNLHWLLDTISIATPSLHLAGTSTTDAVSLSVLNEDLRAEAVVEAPLDTIMRRADNLATLLKKQIDARRADIDALQHALPQLDLSLTMGSDNLAAQYMSDMGIKANNLWLTAHNDSLMHLNGAVGGLNLSGTQIDSVSVDVNQHGKYLIYKGMMKNSPGSKLAEFADVNIRGYIADYKLSFLGTQHNQQGNQGYKLGAIVTMQDSLLTLRMVPYNPVIAYKQWQVNNDNFLSYNYFNKHIDADLTLSGNGSALHIVTSPIEPPSPDYSPKELILEATNIKLQDWLAISPFAPPISGTVNATARLHREHGELVGLADVSIADLIYDRRRVGDFGLDLKVTNDPVTRTLHADGSLNVNGRQAMTINGALNDSTHSNPFMLDFAVIHFPLEVANPFIPARTASLAGTLNGKMKITGSTMHPIFDGYLQFDSASVKVDMIGARYMFGNEQIPVDSGIVNFNNFKINTLNDNPLVIDGTANLHKLSNVGLDLRLHGNDMLLVNSTRARGADIYGRGFIGLDATVQGNMTFMRCNAQLALLAGSNVTYVLSTPPSQLTNYSTGDMVKFVNFNDTTQVANVDSVKTTMALLLNAALNVQDNTTINVDISADGKNRAQIMGAGSLDFSMSPQSTRLTGRYNINSGFVRYTPPFMSEKNFKFQSGSYINFTGDMLNPALHLEAIDAVKANVTPEGGGNSRLINFDVGLSVNGTLNDMNVAFNLSTNEDITIQNELQSMSADQRANQAMNLLLYNTYTGPGSKGNANLSGNPLYSFLASQLNSFSANYIKGVDLTFGINQYDKTFNGASNTATTYSYQLSKSMLDNRIRIVVGGNYTTDANTNENFAENLINDISFEYLLNRTGSMYIRVFRHTGYESILEGEVTATGVGFVYKRNLTTLRDMFKFRKSKPTTTGNDKQK